MKAFSHVIKPKTIHILLVVALTLKWTIHEIDINNVFLHGLLNEEVYVTQH